MKIEDMKNKKQILKLCYHCGSKGLMYVVGEATSNWDDYDNEGHIVYWREKHWIMLQCPACEQVSLYTEYQAFDTPLDIEYVYPQNTFEGFYPRNRSNSHYVPREIQDAFETALKVQYINSQLCLVSMRKTLELICKGQGATGSSLEQLVESLINRNWPQGYNDICWIIRNYGNIAAHANPDEPILHSSYINELMNYLYKIIEYLYIMPKRMSGLKFSAEYKKSNLR